MRKEKMVKMGDQLVAVMVTEEIVMHRTDEDPRLLAMVGLAVAQANVVTIGKMVKDVEQYKGKLSQMKETLMKERGEGQDLKRKYYDTLSDFEKLREAYQMLESDKAALTFSIENIEGKKRDLEGNILQLEEQKDATNKRVESRRNNG